MVGHMAFHYKSMKKLKIAQFGLGPIGIETLKLASRKPWVEVVGGIDIDPDKIGRDLGELTQEPDLRGVRIFRSVEELVDHARPEVILHTAVSKVKDAFPQLLPMVREGINVVSSCEELLFPQLREPELAMELDALCKKHGARIVGTGVNPGFVMDVVPVCMTGVCRDVRAIHVTRVVDATSRRGPLQKKIGSGWTPEEFERRFIAGTAGHAGLKESLALIAHCLGWNITDLIETGRAMVADHDIITPHVSVKTGQCCGIHQYAEASRDGTVCLTLDIKMYLDAANPHDACLVEADPPLNVLIKGGVAGDAATVASLVNAAPRLLKSEPGLRLMTDLPVPCWA